MRLTTNMIYNQGLSAVTSRQSKLVDVQNQLARETKILTPADDPAGKAQALALTDRIKQNEQFQKNSDLVVNDLQRQESVLSNITDSMFRAKELFVQAGNGALSADDRKALALELEVLRDNSLDMMNAQNENGDYMFSGYQTEVLPFTFNAQTGVYDYNGDNGKKNVQITSSLRVQSSSPGSEAFQQTPVELKARVGNVTGALTGGTTLVADRPQWNDFHQANYDKENPGNNLYTVEFAADGASYEVVDSTGAVVQAAVPYADGDAVEFNGMELYPEGNVDGGTVEFRLSQPQQNIATVFNDMINVMNDETLSSEQLSQAIEFSISDLASAENSLGSVRAKTGSRLNSAENAKMTNVDFEIANKETRSKIQDVDYAEAMTELTKQDTALQAAQATFTRITRLSLFDYLR
ncbi:flagellar hook-associated protein 3 [Aliidiomarina minuta]|uniref:Flagellar hook-associated protein 3 n=1 Tax=Aliidiomarina minuta TaxID=880057 RepID=A0A432W8K0_9GAMM|nr:flagellar hook-associated protein FlgL [Aliidiomarina minuta]RUO26392.1 flagellar hook-associated protein 3 [Aliidiomarina minuta]